MKKSSETGSSVTKEHQPREQGRMKGDWFSESLRILSWQSLAVFTNSSIHFGPMVMSLKCKAVKWGFSLAIKRVNTLGSNPRDHFPLRNELVGQAKFLGIGW